MNALAVARPWPEHYAEHVTFRHLRDSGVVVTVYFLEVGNVLVAARRYTFPSGLSYRVITSCGMGRYAEPCTVAVPRKEAA